jgi:hypothetical protein
MEFFPMTSAAKAAANADNAQLSTGPRSADGKARSSRNAIRHGLTSKDLVVFEGQREEFESFRQCLLDELDPQGPLEVLTFNQILHSAWNLQRIRRLEVDLASNGLDPLLDDSAAPAVDRLSRYAARSERAYYRAVAELRALQTDRALRAKLEGDEADQLPAVASIAEFRKQTHAVVTAEALKLALQMVDYETGILRLDAHMRLCEKKLDGGNMTAAAA